MSNTNPMRKSRALSCNWTGKMSTYIQETVMSKKSMVNMYALKGKDVEPESFSVHACMSRDE